MVILPRMPDCKQNKVITDANIRSLYADTITWDCYETIVNEQLGLLCLGTGSNFYDDDNYRLNADPFCANI